MDSLAVLKILLTEKYISEKKLTDSYLETYLDLASNSIARHKGVEEIDEDKYIYEICRMAQLNILKVGAEGQRSHIENGIERIYSYPEIEREILKDISTTLK